MTGFLVGTIVGVVIGSVAVILSVALMMDAPGRIRSRNHMGLK
jgi:hypothetical protein